MNSTVLDKVALGARFTVDILATAAGEVNVAVSCDGRTSTVAGMLLDPNWSGHSFDFHGGVYNQVDYSATTLAEDGSVCIVHDLRISHA